MCYRCFEINSYHIIFVHKRRRLEHVFGTLALRSLVITTVPCYSRAYVVVCLMDNSTEINKIIPHHFLLHDYHEYWRNELGVIQQHYIYHIRTYLGRLEDVLRITKITIKTVAIDCGLDIQSTSRSTYSKRYSETVQTLAWRLASILYTE